MSASRTPRVVLTQWTWDELADIHPVLVVPLGSTEQHGPHLGLGVDSAIATTVAERAVSRVAERSVGSPPTALVAPTLHYGASGEHAGFPGTLSFGTEALARVLIEVGRSADHFSRVLFVCAHGGNAAALDAAVRTLVGEGRSAGSFMCSVEGSDAHAGHTETSMMLHLDPTSVRPFADVNGETRPWSDIGDAVVSSGVGNVSPSGVLGDPSGANSAAGDAFIERMVSSLTAILEAPHPAS